MALDPSISLPSAALLQSIANPPQMASPLELQAKQLALQNARLQSQAYQQSIATGAIQQQQQQLALQQEQATIDAYRNSGGNLPKTIQALQQQGLYTQAFALQKNQNELQDATDRQQAAADLHQNQVNAHKKEQATFMSDLAGGVLAAPEGSPRAIAYDNARSRAVEMYPELDARLPRQYTSDLEPQLQSMADFGKSSSQIATERLTKAKADLQAQAIADFQKNPQAGAAVIDRVVPPSMDQAANASYKAAFQSAMANGGPEAAQKIVEAAATHAAAVSKAVNPNILQAEVTKAVAIERATTPLKIAQAVNTEIQKAKLAPGEFSSVIDPSARNKAIADFEASSKDYADKIGAAAQFRDFVHAAQSGNKAAPGLLGIAELRMLVNRVNRQELEAVTSSAGNAYDRVQGFVSKYTSGQPIPKDVMRDMLAVSDAQSRAAQRTYDYKVNMNRQIYGSNAQPIQLPTNLAGGGGGGATGATYSMTAIGPGNHQIGSNDGRTWFDVQTGQKVQ